MARIATIGFAALLIGVLPLAATADEGQFYFIGRTVATAAGNHVYLRWGATETELPQDVVAFRLLRNGERVDPAEDWPASAVMPPDQIAALYQGVGQQRRRLETITRLNEIASDQGLPFSANQFAVTLHELIDPASAGYNPFWAYLGARADFNIARARYRGWVDTAPVPGESSSVVTYELLAVNASGATARLGLIGVDPAVEQQALGASGLRQIRVTDWRCDLPENAQDQYTVMLDWESPGAGNVADRTAAQTYLAGFDLYRTTDNLGPTVLTAPPRDIASLAAAAGTDERGRPTIDGLEKVNVSLIVDSGAPSIDPEWLQAKALLEQAGITLPDIPPERIPMEPRWLEARDLLLRAGLRPGDRRAYYLVPRDFTGNYGPTVATVVEVPLMTRPPAPWNLRAFADQTSSVLAGAPDAFTFTWDEVDLDNYVKAYQGTRLFCNIVEARASGVLEYVANGESCETGARQAVRLDVADYHIYRFTDFDVAGRFRDSDGDGVEDSAELVDFDGNGRIDAFERSAGLQCDPLVQPPGADNYLVYPALDTGVELLRPRILNPNAEPIARMRDTVPAGNKDTVYWYRIASRARTPLPVGRLSHLGAPQRGLFPDRDPPPEPVVEVLKPSEVPEGCAIEASPGGPWSFSEELSVDEKGEPFTLNCAAGSYTASQLLSANSVQCQTIVAQCGSQQVGIQFPATEKTGGKACNVLVPAGIEFCQSGSVSLVPRLVPGVVPAEPGDLVPGGVTVNVRPPDGRTCIAVYENIEGSFTRVGSTCDPGGLSYTPRPGLFCGYAVATDENNNISATVQFPCTLAPLNPKAPGSPQVLTLDVDDDFARFTFRLPAEQVAMTLARLDHEPGAGMNSRRMGSIPVIDNQPGETISFSMPVESLQGTRDRFCLSLLSVGRDDGSGQSRNSDWSSERCVTRTATGEDNPQYLPWPAVQGAAQGEPLVSGLVSDYRTLVPFLATRLLRSPDLVSDVSDSLDDCWIEPSSIPEAERQDFDTYKCFSGGLAAFRAALKGQIRFILYRQSRVMGGSASDWIQVSPLINYVHFDREVFQISDRDVVVWTLNDPYFKVDVTPTGSLDVWFVDQYPFLSAADAAGTQPNEWRYQAVYFDDQHRPVQWRTSGWFRSAD